MEPGDLPQKSDLPHRAGARPRTRVGLPHVQLDQWPPAEIAERLVALAVNIPGIRAKQSRMAAASSLALCVCDEFAHGPPEAFIDNHEFCLLHSLPQGSIHLTLPYEIREKAIRSGWAEQHPGTKAGIMPSTLVMVYAHGTPRSCVWFSTSFRPRCVSPKGRAAQNGGLPEEASMKGAIAEL